MLIAVDSALLITSDSYWYLDFQRYSHWLIFDIRKGRKASITFHNKHDSITKS